MAFGKIEGSDAGLLQLIGQTRKTCDELARLVAEHSGMHDDHGAVECDSVGPFVIVQLLIGQGSALTSSGANLFEAVLADSIHPPHDEGTD